MADLNEQFYNLYRNAGSGLIEEYKKSAPHYDGEMPAEEAQKFLDRIILKTVGENSTRRSQLKKEGIYYTPAYITRYIVVDSLGRYLKAIRKELEAEVLPDTAAAGQSRYRRRLLEFYRLYEERLKKVRVLDPACGSGAFLNQAFDYLAKEYRWINEQVSKLQKGQTGFYDSEAYKQIILENNLYGVDINKESVEITKLSLWLRTNRKTYLCLDHNTKCGDSLIDDPAVAGEIAFNWEIEFPDVMQNGGFDVVIGNPPWISYGLRGVDKLDSARDGFYRNRYQSAEYKLSTYALFVEKGIELLKTKGRLSYILPDSFLLGRYFSHLREYILDNCQICSLLLTAYDVFKSKASTGRNVIITLQKTKEKNGNVVAALAQDEGCFVNSSFKQYSYRQDYFEGMEYRRFRLFFDSSELALINRVEQQGEKLERHFGLYSGCIARYGQKSLLSQSRRGTFVVKDGNKVIYEDNDAFSCWEKAIISGSQFSRYSPVEPQHFIYINKDPEVLRKITKSGFDFKKYENEKLFIRQTGDQIIATYDDQSLFCLNNVHLVYPKTGITNLKYLLAVLNSKLINYYYKITTLEEGRAMAQLDIDTIKKLPLRLPAPQQEKKIVALVNDMLKLKRFEKKKQTFSSLFGRFAGGRGAVFKNLVEEAGYSKKVCRGRGHRVKDLAVAIDGTMITVYSGPYELIKLEVKDRTRRQYLKLYLENLTVRHLEEINRFSGDALSKVLNLEIPHYNDDQVIGRMLTEWRRQQKEARELKEKLNKTNRKIDSLICEIYGFNEDDIVF